MQDYRDVIIRPVVTERSMGEMVKGKYTFEVPASVNKIEVRQAVENLFNVKVEKVNISNTAEKVKRVGRSRQETTIHGYKKAIVTLKDGETIDIFGDEEK